MKNPARRVRTHLHENKKTYIACGATALVVATATTLYFKGSPVEFNAQQKAVVIGWKNHITQLQFIERSTPSKPVAMIAKNGTKSYFDSLSDAARKTGHDMAAISKNINGHTKSMSNGDMFELVDLN